jgi:predicted nucleotidyltransferase
MPSAAIPGPLLDSLVGTYGPRRIVLFGSHARGEARPDSDLDLLVLLDDNAPEELLGWRRRHEARRGYSGPVDILPCRAGVFAARAQIPGSLAAAIAREGIVVYERG